MKPSLFLSLLLLLPCAGWAATDEASERKQLSQQRADVEARFTHDSQICRTRFAVTDCMNEARARRAAELRPLQAREDELETAQRHARAQAQRERVAEKQREFAAEEGKRGTAMAAPAASAPTVRALPEPRSPHMSPEEHGRAVQAELAAGEREAQIRREQMAARQRDQQEHQQAVQKREQDRAAQGKKPAPALPVPTAAEVAAAASAASAPKR
jgi:hypothetical protein